MRTDAILGVVPARGGSKGVPRKNLAPLAGRPLLAWTAEAALNSRTLSRVVLSTDDEEIAGVGRRLGLDVPFLRPAELAGDDTPILTVLENLLATLEAREQYRPDAVVLLQPTSPLRRSEHVDAAVKLLRDTGADSVVSVVEVPHHFSPLAVLREERGRLRPYEGDATVGRRQDKPQLFARNGPAVLAIRRHVLAERHSLYGDDSRALVMSPEESVDIDSPWDLELAGWILSRRRSP